MDGSLIIFLYLSIQSRYVIISCHGSSGCCIIIIAVLLAPQVIVVNNLPSKKGILVIT